MSNRHVDHATADPVPLLPNATLATLLGLASLTVQQEAYSLAATATIQNYVDRRLIFATYSESHFGTRVGSVQLLEFPVKTINSLQEVMGNSSLRDIGDYRLMRPSGIVLGIWGCGEVLVDYDAGYETMPGDLQLAFMETFKAVEAAAGMGNLGLISRVQVTDVGSVDYDFGGTGWTEGYATPWGVLPSTAVALLHPYRAHGPAGVG